MKECQFKIKGRRGKTAYRISRVCMYFGRLPSDGVLYFKLDGNGGFSQVNICEVESDYRRPYNAVIDVYGPDKFAAESLLKKVEVFLGVRTRHISDSLEMFDRLVENEYRKPFKYN